jgi:phage terminase small subunit
VSKLTARQALSVAAYLETLNASEAARRAGYSAKTANRIGHRLLTNVDIAQAVQARKAKQLDDAGPSAARVLEELRRLAFGDLRRLFDADGNLTPPATGRGRMPRWSPASRP